MNGSIAKEISNGILQFNDDFVHVSCFSLNTVPRFEYEYGANGKAAYVHDNELNQTVWTEYDGSERPIRAYLMENASDTSLGTPKYVNTIITVCA